MPKIDGAEIDELLDLLKRPEYRIRYLAKRELREREPFEVSTSLHCWIPRLSSKEPGYRKHQLEALWLSRWLDESIGDPLSHDTKYLLTQLLGCDEQLARAAAVKRLRDLKPWSETLTHLTRAANDENGIVRMQAAIACSYIGTPEALDIALQTLNHPAEKHVAYAIQCALGSHTLRRHWEGNDKYKISRILAKLKRSSDLKDPSPSASQQQFDLQKNLKTVRISCLPERMLFTVNQFAVTTGQPIKLVFTNPDATDHNLVIVKPGALAEVGMAANAMARDPKNANSNFIPGDKKNLIIQSAPMIGPTRKSQVHVMRFKAPMEPGVYPFVCTFPGHWIIMKGDMVVANDLSEVDQMLAARKPTKVREWKLADFDKIKIKDDEATAMSGMQAFVKAQCNQCHMVAGHGINLGPDLTDIAKRFTGKKLLLSLIHI